MIIRQYLVPPKVAQAVTYGHGNTRRKICVHETDNTKPTATANNHALLQYRGNNRQASWHWQVDENEAIQSFAHSYRCWAAGTTKGNSEAIHVEICVNGDYKKAVQKAALLIAKILHDEGLTINDVVQHHYYSKKNCPRIMRSGSVIPWSSFIQMIASNLQTSDKGALTMSQYKELKELIDTQNKIIQNQAKRIADLEGKTGLTETGRTAIKKVIEKACEEGIFDKAYHYQVEANGKRRIDNYNDRQLQSYLNAYISKSGI